ncbi:MAG: 5-formyltetrahydrofolate cyclo-ligase [Pseudomonas sp.]|jgi:5-formyltetrahydrofolate cyclo-ligase|nr:5-formyltetrahydrofolate cyclo-ligase [Pseudomonas sp.]MDD2224031.1 5-formyltetrahydrofolate cyclo-ligase [Pseudomonas sp.]MDY0414044.1 5-formyltetrahydrofolate cyclo-ligase [Pseudomonas sp.]NLO55255.1 5-formyltetrahydrofolate cyclo-ligase [Gammaproteobacteria bacterium]
MQVNTSLSRAQLRSVLRQRRRSLSPSQQAQAAQQLYRQLVQHPLFLRAQHIALYIAGDGEIDPQPLIREAWRRGKQVYLPVLPHWPQTAMVFQRVRPIQPWEKNRFGILQPRWCTADQRAVWTLDAVFLPLVGFDRCGGRLGMGGGFYDRCFAALHQRDHLITPQRIGLAHECQRVECVPLAPWDVPLHAVVTDQQWYAATT